MFYLELFSFFLSILIIGLIPFPILYGLSSVFYFFVYMVFGYRKKVVLSNLQGSFPDKSSEEIRRLMSLFYIHLTDVLLEGVKAFTMTRRQVIKRHRIINPEVLEHFYKNKQSIIGVTGHYCNWEWGSLSASLQTPFNTVAFYMPLQNKTIDKFVRWSRSRFGTTLASVAETSNTFAKYKNSSTVFLMASDQGMASKYKSMAIWVQFLNRDTAFLHGMEKHARNNNLPVVYVDVQRVKRGYYTVELSVLTTNPNELPEGKLTEMYARKLESIILKKPENWLWSHRRWKMSR